MIKSKALLFLVAGQLKALVFKVPDKNRPPQGTDFRYSLVQTIYKLLNHKSNFIQKEKKQGGKPDENPAMIRKK